jgi:polyhydroxybutyrate depolymerase
MALKDRRGLVITVLAILLPACAVAAGTFWAVGPSQSCRYSAQGSAQPGWSARTVVSSGLERCYHLYVPRGYDPSERVPVVLSLHGFLSNPNSHGQISLWHKLADREGFLVVYPEGTSFPQRWNAHNHWTTAGVDDVQLLLDILDDVSAVAAADRSRVYVNGLSNGGGMTVRIGCEAADKVAAIGTVAGAVVDMESCSPSRPVPLMAFHGTDDPIVPYEGGPLRGEVLQQGAGLTGAPPALLGAEDWVATWAVRNGCARSPQAIPPHGDARGVRYTECDEGAEVILHTIAGGGHTWPGGTPIPIVGKTSGDIDATEEMWKFFQVFRLDDQRYQRIPVAGCPVPCRRGGANDIPGLSSRVEPAQAARVPGARCERVRCALERIAFDGTF